MSLTIKEKNYGSDHGGHPPLAVRGGFSNIEATSQSRVIVDGLELDLSGASSRESISHFTELRSDGIVPSVTLIRQSDGNYLLDIIQTLNSVVSSESTTGPVTTYPFAIIGTAGQTVARTHSGNITQTDGLRATFQTFHETAQALSKKLQDKARAGEHPPDLVTKGASWIYYAAYAAAYMVGKNTVFTYDVRMRWALTGIGVMNSILAEDNSETLYSTIDPIATIPSVPMLVVDPATGSQIPFDSAVIISPGESGYPSAPGVNEISSGNWIQTIIA